MDKDGVSGGRRNNRQSGEREGVGNRGIYQPPIDREIPSLLSRPQRDKEIGTPSLWPGTAFSNRFGGWDAVVCFYLPLFVVLDGNG